jgi:N-acetylneuraminic acid mutarotase
MNTVGGLNDLWKYSPVTGEWTWVSGSSSANPAASYGTLGVAAPTNVPDGREPAASWIDSSDNLWLFGGGSHNDLWKFTPSTNQWTWVSGPNTLSGLGVYGTLGSSAAANVPGSRAGAASWIDASGNFWLFGGEGIIAPQTSGLLNDLWMFSPGTGQWTWVSGSSSGDVAGVYGTLGTAAPTNAPGGRANAAAWIDGTGDLWLFGGTGSDSPIAGAELNDLWEYQR